MPLIDFKKTENQGLIGIWEITESVESLYQKLPQTQNFVEFEKISHPNRQKEWLAVRVLAYQVAQELGQNPSNLIKNEFNCPYFEDSTIKISLSHTENYAVVFAHPNHKLGVDIEAYSPKMEKITPRVFDKTELETANTPEKIAQIWCAKEAVYKFYMKKSVDFRQDIHIRYENKNLVAYLHKIYPTQKLPIYVETIDKHIIAYCYSAE